MLNPFDQDKDPGSYFNLQKRIFQHVQSSGVNNQIIDTVHKSYEDALNAENIVLTRTESKRLRSQILRLMLEDLIRKLDDGSILV
jgi:hypothetical protein